MSSWLERVYAQAGVQYVAVPDPEPSVDYSGLKVAELRELLEAQGLPTNGRKADLIARLEENSEESIDGEEEE